MTNAASNTSTAKPETTAQSKQMILKPIFYSSGGST